MNTDKTQILRFTQDDNTYRYTVILRSDSDEESMFSLFENV
jgi:hypothetical protein